MSRMTEDEAAAEQGYEDLVAEIRNEVRAEMLAEGVDDLQLQAVVDDDPDRIVDLVARNPHLRDLIEAAFARRMFLPNPYRSDPVG